jgi:outer membrane protein
MPAVPRQHVAWEHIMMKTVLFLTLAMATASTACSPAEAQQALGDTVVLPEKRVSDERDGSPSGLVALGVAIQPEFEGSSKYQLAPFAIATIRWKGVDLQVRGLRTRADLLADSPFQIGPVISSRAKRDAKDAKGALAKLADIDSALEIGGFVGYRLGGDKRGRGEVALDVTVLKDVSNSHDGLLATAQVSYAAVRSREFFADLDVSTTFGTAKYTRTYFGVTPEESSASGLSAYRPGGGLRDVGAGVTAGYQFNSRWGLLARIGASKYVGDAKDSPVVAEGSKVQALGGVGISFRF